MFVLGIMRQSLEEMVRKPEDGLKHDFVPQFLGNLDNIVHDVNMTSTGLWTP